MFRIAQHLKTALLLPTLLCSGVLLAQYNHAYTSLWNYNFHSYPIASTARDIVEAEPGNQVVLSILTAIPFITGQDPDDYLINLKKIDNTGADLWNRTYQFHDNFYKLEPWRLIRTDDEGFIIVGRAYDKSANPSHQMLSNPFAVKVDNNGNFVWSYLYRSNYFSFADSVHTAITKVEDDTTEAYMIVRSGSSRTTSQYIQDVTINILKIDGSGIPMWNKKYSMQSRTTQDTLIRNFPATITYVPDTSGDFYFIAGTQRYNGYNGLQDSNLFFMGVDRAGNVVRSYHWLHVPSFPYNEDAIFDDASDENSIVLSYTHGNSDLVDHSKVRNNSQIGVMKLDRNLNITMMKYYWSPSPVNHEAVRIKRNTFNNSYIIACNVRDSGANAIPNIGMLRIQKDGYPLFMRRYNVRRPSKAYSNVSFTDGSGSEFYSIVGQRSSDYKLPFDIRILNTDDNLLTCGAQELTALDSTYIDSVRTRTYAPVDTNEYDAFDLNEVFPDQIFYDCDYTTADNFKYPLVEKGSRQSSSGVSVYPTLLQSSANRLTIEINNQATNGDIKVVLYSSDGRVAGEKSFTVLAGTNKLQWSLPQIAQGTYTLHVTGVNNESVKVFRLVQL